MAGVKRFAIECSNDNGATWHNKTYSRGTFFTIENLEKETRYWFRAYAIGSGGRRDSWSEPVTLFVV